MSHVNLPPQLSEATFRTYEPYLNRAIKAWPDETRFTREEMVNEKTQRPLSPATFAGRMRDAVVSLHRFGWETYIDREKFVSIFGTFSVAMDADGSVWFRNRGRKGRPLTFAGEAPAETSVTPDAPVVWSEWEADDIRALCRLLHSRKFPGTVIAKGVVPSTLIADLETSFDVGIFVDTPNNQTVIS